MFSKIKWHCFGVFIVTFEYIWRFVDAFTVWSCRAGLRLDFLACFDFRISIRHIISNFCNFSISTPPNKNLQKIITLKCIFVFVEWCYIFNILWHSMKMYVVLQLRKLKTQKKSSECHFRQTKIWPLDRKQQINVLDCFIFVTFMLADWNMPEGFHT